ncbi:MAG: phosphate signaling complex protein PhoU [Akkermansiaceae bacterium]|nr:phosphate signaling complex protein PhoU [Akkermansiaceae bacterium]
MNTRHILHDFNDAMDLLREEIVKMGAQTRSNLDRAVEGLVGGDLELCKLVIADDNEVDDAQVRIDGISIEILLKFHPVATDLRFVLSAMKVASNLERISDHAVNIAKRGRKILGIGAAAPDPDLGNFRRLYMLAASELADALVSLLDSDASLGESLQAKDKELDRLYKEIVAGYSANLASGGARTDIYLHLIFACRSLERIGDLSQNIGEDAVYLGKAKDIRHRRDEI